MATENRGLRESEERYRTIVTATPELILICRNGLVDYINGSGAAMLGAQSADLILARPVIELLGADTAASVRERVLASLSTGGPSGAVRGLAVPVWTDRHSAPNSPACRCHPRPTGWCC